ncbi:membrane protein [Kiloniella litopenaei]|uniref:Membrane protein n=1 Tax=Kiloniella litopenaei TaxID=1549748 RepID=A0A0M2REW7_9PROT|nr:isoprenylcysteine carboxylmethyltransferase family protein [Kiloniella litopenaei]KKJ78118.1 membrane protein [Kiloniella litopenaei]
MKKLLPPVLFLIFIILMAVLCWQQGSPHTIPDGYNLLAIPFIAGGLALAFSGSRLFKRKRTNIMTFGQPDVLVTEGVFRWSRNPMYLGFVTALLGFALLLGGAYSSFALAVLFLVITDRWYITFEEKIMRKKFGPAYEAYCQKVRRWI